MNGILATYNGALDVRHAGPKERRNVLKTVIEKAKV
jgi:hypothetical protein